MTEEWRAVPGFEQRYEVSNLGRVRSLDRYFHRPPSRRKPDPDGWKRLYRGRILKPCPTSTGHLSVNLGTERDRAHLVHRLVLLAFVGPCPPGKEGLHGDDVRSNNRLDNLRWGTRGENYQDAVRNGRRNPRKANG